MSQVFLEVYHLTDEGIAEVPVQSAVCLFLLTYLQNPPNISVYMVLSEPTTPSLCLRVQPLMYTSIDSSALKAPVTDCSLPVFAKTGTSSCVAGLCSVLRKVVKHSGAEWHHLLGFRQGCLFACAEVSSWTKFCEIDIVQVVQNVISQYEPVTAEVKVSSHLARFEEHLKQPVRMHNVEKLRHKIKRDVNHDFAEGHEISLADLIIAPCIHVFIQAFNSPSMTESLPFIWRWYDLVTSQQHVAEALSTFQDIPNRVNSVSKVSYIVPEVPQYSLYKSDPKRYKPRWKQFTKQEDVEEALKMVEDLSIELDYDMVPFGHELTLDWQTIPGDIQPDVPASRLVRKRHQLENLSKAIIKVARPGDVIVDFCCGSGHLGIVVAYCLPDCRVVLLDNKEQSLKRAKKRVAQLGLDNISVIQCNLDYFNGSFQIGVSLHACGVASDLVIHSCLQRNASFVVCPCCYGGLQDNHMVTYPQSKEMEVLPLYHYLVLGHCADQTHKKIYAKSAQGELCMAAVDRDRCLFAQNKGYSVSLAKLVPEDCSPKNNLLVGIPQNLSNIKKTKIESLVSEYINPKVMELKEEIDNREMNQLQYINMTLQKIDETNSYMITELETHKKDKYISIQKNLIELKNQIDNEINTTFYKYLRFVPPIDPER